MIPRGRRVIEADLIDGAKENLANEVVEANEAYLANEADTADKPDEVFVINKPAEAEEAEADKANEAKADEANAEADVANELTSE